MPAAIHPTAIVDEGATIGDDTRVWHWTHISPGARIGRGCSLGQNVYVASTAVIGDGKVGGPFDAVAARGRMVAADGFILRRGTIEMLVSGTAPRLLDGPAPPPPATEPLGRWRITGEICDGKTVTYP